MTRKEFEDEIKKDRENKDKNSGSISKSREEFEREIREERSGNTADSIIRRTNALTQRDSRITSDVYDLASNKLYESASKASGVNLAAKRLSQVSEAERRSISKLLDNNRDVLGEEFSSSIDSRLARDKYSSDITTQAAKDQASYRGQFSDKKDYYLSTKAQEAYQSKLSAMESPDFDYYKGLGIGDKVKEPTYEEKLGYVSPYRNSFSKAYMSQDEVDVYNYYLAKEGQASADKFLESISEELSQREGFDIASGLKINGEGNTIGKLVYAVASGIDQTMTGLAQFMDVSSDYLAPSANQVASQVARENMGSDTLRTAYDALSTSAAMLPNQLISFALRGTAGRIASGLIMGFSSAGSTYAELLNSGMDKKSARTLSTLLGAWESISEEALGGIEGIGGRLLSKGADKLIFNNVKKGALTAFTKFVLDKGLDIAEEGWEEQIQNVGSDIIIALYSGKTVKDILDGNYDQTSAEEQSYSFVLGALSAFILNGAAGAVNVASTVSQAKNIKADGTRLQALTNLAKSYSPETVAYKIAGKVDENTSTVQIARMLHDVEARFTEQTKATMSQKLQEAGVGDKDALTITEAIGRVVEGEKLTRAQEKALDMNDTAQRVFKEYIIDANSTYNQRLRSYDKAVYNIDSERGIDVQKEAMKPRTLGGNTIYEAAERVANDIAAKDKVSNNSTETLKGMAKELKYSPEFTEQVVSGYDGFSKDLSVPEYLLGVNEAYSYGKVGFNGMSREGFSTKLDAGLREKAFLAGQKDAETARKARSIIYNGGTGKGTIHYEGSVKDLTDIQKASVKTIARVTADIFKGDVYFFTSENRKGSYVVPEGVNIPGKNAGDTAPNGWYDPTTRSIYLDLNAGNKGKGTMLYTFAHELTHDMKQNAKDQYKNLVSYLLEAYGKTDANVAGLVAGQEAKMKAAQGGKVNPDVDYFSAAFDEFVADSMESLFTDANLAARMEEIRLKDATLFEKIKSFFTRLYDQVRSAYKGLDPDSLEGRYVKNMKDDLGKIADLFAEGAVAAGRAGTSQNAGNNVSYSDRVSEFENKFTELENGDLRADLSKLTDADWNIIFKATKKAGYDIRSAEDAKTVFSRFVETSGFNADQAASIKKAYGIEADNSNKSNSERIKLAKKLFGTTQDFREAGYLLTDGTMLDFSGKKNGGPAHERYMDHREIAPAFNEKLGEEYGPGDYTRPMNAFIDEGNIRLINTQGITIGETEPTAKQYSVLKRFIEFVLDREGYFYLDLSNTSGYTVESREYKEGDSGAKIVGDIKAYFKNGELPYRSDLQQYRYSDRTDIIDANGTQYDHVIDVDDDFTKRTVSSQRRYEKFIKKLAGKTIGVTDINGKSEAVTFAYESDRTSKNNNHPVLGELLYAKGDLRKSTIVNISDSLKVSFDSDKTFKNDSSHGWMDERGWSTKKCYILSDGVIYPAYLRIALARDGRNILYAVNVVKNEGVNAARNLPKLAGRTETPSSETNLSYPSSKVKNKKNETVYSDRDSSGKSLSDGQINFFAESKNRDKDGNLLVMYHGTKNYGFTVFDPKKARSGGTYGNGFYFSTEGHAAQYGDRYKVYLNLKNPLMVGTHDITEAQLRKFVEAIAENEDYGLENYGYNATVDSVVGQLKGKTDFAILNDLNITSIGNMVEELKYFNEINGTSYDGIIAPTETVAFYSNQIKDVTNLNPTSDPDIHHSERDTQALAEQKKINEFLTKQNAKLKEDNARLKELVKLQKQVTNGKLFTQTSLESVAGRIMKAADIKNYQGAKADFVPLLTDAYNYIVQNENISMDGFREAAQPAIDWLAENVNISSDLDEDARAVFNFLKKTKVYISPELKSEIASKYGSYNDFRKALLGRVEFTTDPRGRKIDSLFAELAEEWPQYFDADTSEKNMPEALYDTVMELKDRGYNLNREEFLYYKDFFAEDMFSRIYDGYWDVSTLYTVADRYQKQINILKSQHKNTLKEVRDARDAKIKEIKADYTERKNKALADQKASYIEKMDTLKKRYEEKAAKKNEAALRRDLIAKIIPTAMSLQTRLEKPSPKTAIPKAFAGAVAKFVGSLDFTTFDANGNPRPGVNGSENKSNMTRAKVRQSVNNLADSLEDMSIESEYGQLDLSPDMVTWIQNVKQALEEEYDTGDTTFYVRQMTGSQLDSLYKVLKNLEHAINNASKMYSEMSSSVSDLAYGTISHLKPLAGKTHNSLLEGAAKIFRWDYAQPVTVFDRLGASGNTLMKMLMKGQKAEADNVELITTFVDSAYTEKEVNEWRKEKKTVQIGGKKYTVTTAFLMDLFNLYNDPDANRHIVQGGGIRFDDLKLDNKVTRFEDTFVSQSEVEEMLSMLTERQQEVARNIERFTAEQGAAWGNKISMRRFGIEAFGVPNYWPIRTIKAGSEYEAKQRRANIYALLNKSFTKERNINAKNAIIVGDMFEVFNNHMAEMALYNAWALPVVDLIKWFNYREAQDINNRQSEISVKEALRQAYGRNADEYIRRLLESINSQKSNGLSEDLAFKSLRTVNRVAVAGNIRVAVQQPFSITRAFELISPRYCKPLVGKARQEAYDEMVKHSSFGKWKGLGYYDVDISRPLATKILKDEKLTDKVTDFSMKAAEDGDAFTWAVLWNACRSETKAKNPNLTNAKLMEKTAERFDDLIARTQVVDSVLTKSQWMRSDSFWHRMTSSFMSESMTSYNTLLRQYDRFSRDSTIYGEKQALVNNAKPIATTTAVFILTQLINALVTAPIDAARDDDDYKSYLEKLLDNFKSSAAENLLPTGMMPYIADIAEYAIYGKTDRPDIQLYTKVIDLGKQITSTVQNYSYFKLHALLKSSLSMTSSLTGLPFSNVTRDVVSIWNSVVGQIGNGELKFQTSEDKSSVAYDKMYKALDKGDTDKAAKLYAQLKSNTVEDSSIKSGMTTRIHKAYDNGDLTANEAIDMLIAVASYTDKPLERKDAVKKVADWNEE